MMTTTNTIQTMSMPCEQKIWQKIRDVLYPCLFFLFFDPKNRGKIAKRKVIYTPITTRKVFILYSVYRVATFSDVCHSCCRQKWWCGRLRQRQRKKRELRWGKGFRRKKDPSIHHQVPTSYWLVCTVGTGTTGSTTKSCSKISIGTNILPNRREHTTTTTKKLTHPQYYR